MVNEQEIIIGEICHIEGEKPGSARYNDMMSNKQRNDFDNLILLCRNHHKEVDTDLVQMKLEHRNKMPL